MATEDLTPWLNRVKKASTRTEVFSILDEFRKLDWTDEQCAVMGKLYIRLVERLSDDAAADSKQQVAAAAAAEDEEVWYEKM